MDLQELIEEAPAVVSVVAAIGLAFLLPLFLSQRRDIERLRAWMEREPEHPSADLAASETLLDRAEAELEELLGPEAATEVRPAAGATPTTPLSAATRVTHERPALERITMERSALAPHPRWRRFAARATQARVLIAVGVVALAVGIAGILVTQEVILSDGDGGATGGGRIERSDVPVTVLNGTAVPGLAQTVSTEVKSNGYPLREVGGVADPGFAKTEVLYADGAKPAAQKVAKDLGLNPANVEPFDRDARLRAGGASVIVIAGEDRVQP